VPDREFSRIFFHLCRLALLSGWSIVPALRRPETAWKSHLSRSTEKVRGNYSDPLRARSTAGWNAFAWFVNDYIICVEGHGGAKPAPSGHDKGGTAIGRALEKLSRFQTTRVGKNVPGSYITGCFRRSPTGEGHARGRRIYGQLVETITVKSDAKYRFDSTPNEPQTDER